MEVPPLFFERHPNPMLIYDVDTLEILEVNKRAQKKYEFTRDEFRKLTVEDIRPPEDIPEFRSRLESVKGKSQIFDQGTIRHQTKEGNILYVQITAQDFPVKERNARIVHIHDVTKTIQLQKEKEEAYHEQQHLIENNPLGMVKYDKDFRIVEWSKTAVESTGYSKEEILGKSVFDLEFFEEKEARHVKKRMSELASGEKDKDRFEAEIRVENDTVMELLIHASALYNREGNLKSILAFIEDITERKNYERQLEKRERKYRHLFEDANDGILLISNRKIIDCNERITDILNGSKEDIIGRRLVDLSPEKQPDGQSSTEKAQQKLNHIKKGNPQVFEWKHKRFDGGLIDTEVSLNKLEFGDESYIQAILRDITEHKQIKSELKIEQKRLKRAQNLARLGWWNYNTQEDRLIWSEVLYDILDVDKDNFGATLQSFKNLVLPEDRPKLEQVLNRAQQNQEALDFVLRLKKPNDKIIYAKCRAKSEFDEKGELKRLSGVLQDITNQKKAQDELKRNKELFESLFLDSPVAIAMIDVDGKVQKINHSFEELFGYTEEELTGKDLLKHQLPEERYDEIEKIYEHVFSEEGASKYYEDQRITKSGETRDLLVGALPVSIDEEPIAAFGIYTDISKLRSIENDLKNSLQEKEILLAEIHHRVKNNLAVISGLLELEAMNWDENQEVSNVLNDSMLRIKSIAMIHEQLYKSEDFANLEFDDYVHELVNLVSDTLNVEEKEISLQVESDNIEINVNQAIPCALIVNELVANAFEHAFSEKEDGELRVALKQKGEKIAIKVSDNGMGLPDGFKIDDTSTLGLSMVRQLTKQLKGELHVEDNRGTRIEIEFPIEKRSGSASNYFV